MQDSFETESDLALIERSKKGEEKAFDELTRRYRGKIFQLCLHMLHDHELADDVTQEAFIHAYRGLNNFHMLSSFYTWVYRIAVNLSLNKIKKQKAIEKAELRELSYSTKEGQEYVDRMRRWLPEDRIDHQEIQEAIDKGLKKLSSEHKVVLMMYDVEGISQKEIADILRVPEGTVRSRLHYARQQMKSYLKKVL